MNDCIREAFKKQMQKTSGIFNTLVDLHHIDRHHIGRLHYIDHFQNAVVVVVLDSGVELVSGSVVDLGPDLDVGLVSDLVVD